MRLPSGLNASNDKTAKLWDAERGTELLTLRGHTSSVYSAAFSPDGSRILTAGLDAVKVWDARPVAPFTVDHPKDSP